LFERGKEFVRRHTRINRHVRSSFSNAVRLRWSNPLELQRVQTRSGCSAIKVRRVANRLVRCRIESFFVWRFERRFPRASSIR